MMFTYVNKGRSVLLCTEVEVDIGLLLLVPLVFFATPYSPKAVDTTAIQLGFDSRR